MAEKEAAALWECFKRALTPLVDARVTPERYKLAVDGVCWDEERAALEAAEAYLSASDGGHPEITNRTMTKLRAVHREQRAQLVSQYVALYETIMVSNKPKP